VILQKLDAIVSNETTLGAFVSIFSKSLPGFSGSLRMFFQIFTDFAGIYRDFAWIFDNSKLSGVRLQSLQPVSNTSG